MESQGKPCDQPKPSLRAAVELPEVVAGDVLDDLAAGACGGAVAEDDGDAKHEVPHRPVAVAPRAAQVRGEAGTDRRIRARVEREHLSERLQVRVQRREAETGLDDAGQVAGLVLEDAVEAAG